MGDTRGGTWFGLFDEVGMVKLVKGVTRLGIYTFFGERQSRGTWHPVRMVGVYSNRPLTKLE